MIRVLLLDDEPLALRLLQGYAEKVEGLHVVAAGSDPFDMIERIRKGEADLLFLDIQMPELHGIQLFRIVQDQIAVVLSTAYEQYSLQGFDYHAVDYLLKPIAFDRFERAVQRAAQRQGLDLKPGPAALHQPLAPASGAVDSVQDAIFVRADSKWVRVPFNNLYYLEANRDYVTLHLRGGSLRTQQSLQRFEDALPSDRFARIHRSFLVSLHKLDYVEHARVCVQGKHLPIGDHYRSAFFQRFDTH
jgi:DNA-binding LytR/AlgR family response regulator